MAVAALALASTAANPPDVKPELDCLRVLDGIDLQFATITQLHDAMAAGDLTSEELTARSLQRIAAFDDDLNAVRALASDALAQARVLDAEYAATGRFRGPLHGLPVLLKDNIGTTDMPTTAGSIALEGNVPDEEAVVTTRLRHAGAIILGKANLSEFANWVSLTMPNGYSSLGGQVVAPYRFGKDPLGSSTGSAVAAAMAYGTFAIGTETSGSIISPATVQGLAAIKPTKGSVSIDGIIPLAPSFDVAGPMGRSVEDVAIALSAMDEVDVDHLVGLSDTSLEGARIGVRSELLDQLLDTFPAEHDVFVAALDDLVAQGATIVTIEEPLPTLANASLAELGAIFNEFKVGINEYLATEANVTTGVQTLTDIIDFNAAHQDRIPHGQLLLELSDLQTGHPLDPVSVASATAAITASQTWIDHVLGDLDLDVIAAPNFEQANLAAAAGYPNVTVPAGYDASNPQGLSLIGTAGDDGQLLSFAYDYEQATRHRIAPTQINGDLAYCAEGIAPDLAYDVVAESDF